MKILPFKFLPSCESLCLCCPTLRPSSRHPVKRYKKLLADIFPKNLEGPPSERKIAKLCEYASRNPLRIPKICRYLEQKIHKELRLAHFNYVRIIAEVYKNLLLVCNEQQVYFASSLLKATVELLDNKHANILILGCETLTKFIYSQVNNVYAHNIEELVCKVCMLCHEHGEEHNHLRAASLQCLSAMIWFMTECSYIFVDFDEIIHAVLENYQLSEHGDVEGQEVQHNWVDEITRGEGRAGVITATDDVLNNSILRLRTARDSLTMTREERESPEVWSLVCVHKLAEMGRESSTLHRVLDLMLGYFDRKQHWVPPNGLALRVFSDMFYLENSTGNEQLILAAIIRHLDHKNVCCDPQMKSHILMTATSLARQLRLRGCTADIGTVSDLFRHLRKIIEATEAASVEELSFNESLRNLVEDCLLEIIRGMNDARQLYDVMAITLEKLPTVSTVARATIMSLLIVSHIISLAVVSSNSPEVFPDVLLLQLIKAMTHPDIETRLGAHNVFCTVLVRSTANARGESEFLYETKKWQSRTTSAFASATALLEKLRREKGSLSCDKHESIMKERKISNEDRHNWAQKSSAYFSKLVFSFVNRFSTLSGTNEMEDGIITLSEDQIAQLLSAFWVQANQADNMPFNFEAISRSYTLTLLSSRLKNSSQGNIARIFQLPLSLQKIALIPTGTMSPACQRSLFTLSSSMVVFAGKVYQIPEIAGLVQHLTVSNNDPFFVVGEDLQLHARLHPELLKYGSESDQRAAKAALHELRKSAGAAEQLVDAIAAALSDLSQVDQDVLIEQLTETFMPDDVPFFGSNSALDWSNIQRQAVSEESLSFDEECSRTSSVDGADRMCSPAAIGTTSTSNMPSSFPQVIGVRQLLESALHAAGQVAGASISASPIPYGTITSQCEALGVGMRKKLSSWLVNSTDAVRDGTVSEMRTGGYLVHPKVNLSRTGSGVLAPSEPPVTLWLPPASPFDNFLKAARC